MLHKSMAFLVSVAIAFCGFGAASAAQGDLAKPVQAPGDTQALQRPQNASPLPHGGAAGVKQAQGSSTNDWLLIGGGILIGAGILILVAGGGDEDNSTTVTTGSN